jgi:membrane protease YdiL (CAAX protease family)
VVLHLFPGVPFTVAFFLLVPLLTRQGGSSYLALLICIPLFLLPVELGLLVAARKKAGSSWEPLRIRSAVPGGGVGETALTIVVLYLLVGLVAALLTPLDGFLAESFSGLRPNWPMVDRLPEDVSLVTLGFGLLASGLAAPIVEELYFRAFLLPRIPLSPRLAPLFNVALFALYHFYAPWKYPTIFFAFLPLVYYYQQRGNLIAVTITHCLINSVGIGLAAAAML